VDVRIVATPSRGQLPFPLTGLTVPSSVPTNNQITLWDSGELSVSSVSEKLLHPLRLHHIHWQALAAHTRNVTRHIIDPVAADPEQRVLVRSGINFRVRLFVTV
jgi:hypothetical protein